jgi:hypothetical protein
MFVLGSSDMYALLLFGNAYGSLDSSKTSDTVIEMWAILFRKYILPRV